MDLADLISGNLLCVTSAYHFNVISADPDGNIFTDCAIAAGADFFLSDDRHFASLAEAGYRPRPMSPGVFVTKYFEGGQLRSQEKTGRQ